MTVTVTATQKRFVIDMVGKLLDANEKWPPYANITKMKVGRPGPWYCPFYVPIPSKYWTDKGTIQCVAFLKIRNNNYRKIGKSLICPTEIRLSPTKGKTRDGIYLVGGKAAGDSNITPRKHYGMQPRIAMAGISPYLMDTFNSWGVVYAKILVHADASAWDQIPSSKRYAELDADQSSFQVLIEKGWDAD